MSVLSIFIHGRWWFFQFWYFFLSFCLIHSSFKLGLTHCDIVMSYGDRSGQTLVQVIACCHQAASHYLNQCWLLISEVLQHSPGNNSIASAQAIDQYNEFANYTIKITTTTPRGQWVNWPIRSHEISPHFGELKRDSTAKSIPEGTYRKRIVASCRPVASRVPLMTWTVWQFPSNTVFWCSSAIRISCRASSVNLTTPRSME